MCSTSQGAEGTQSKSGACTSEACRNCRDDDDATVCQEGACENCYELKGTVPLSAVDRETAATSDGCADNDPDTACYKIK